MQEDFSCGLGEEGILGLPAPPSEAKRMGVGLAPAGGLGGSRLGLVFKLPAETLLLACRVLGCASPLKLASSLEEEKEELVERLAGAAGLSLEETLASGVSVLEVLVAVGVWTVGSEELLGTKASSVSPSTLAELSELMLSRLRAGDGVEDDGSECDSLEMGWWARGEALGARGAGRFFVFGLLVGVMPYQGWRGLAAVSLCSCSGVLLWVAALSSSSSSSSSKGLYGLGSVVSDLLSSLLAFPTSSPSSSSEVLLGVSWPLPGGGGGAGFFLGSACTKAIHGGSLALAAAPARSEEQGLPRGFGTGGLGSGTLPFTMPGPHSLPSPWRVDLGRGTG